MNESAASPDMTCQQFADFRHAIEAARRRDAYVGPVDSMALACNEASMDRRELLYAFDEAVSLIRVLVAYGHQPLPADLVMQAGDWLATHAPLDCPI